MAFYSHARTQCVDIFYRMQNRYASVHLMYIPCQIERKFSLIEPCVSLSLLIS